MWWKPWTWRVWADITSEPEFTPDDVRVMTARMLRKLTTGPHGQPMDEATSQLASGAPWSTYRYVVPPPVTDYAALALEQAKKAWRDKNPDADDSHLLWSVERKPTS